MKKKVLAIIAFAATAFGYSQNNPLELWYSKPASQWEETLPLGNGRLGMTPDSGINTEKVVLNDITLWSGSPQDANNYEASKYLPQIRQLLLQGKNKEAEELINQNFVCKGPGSGSGDGANVQFGCYQVLGNLTLNFDYKHDMQVSNYRRSLDISTATATARFDMGGITYTREYLTSFDDDVAIIKLTASKKGALNFSVGLDRPECFETYNEDNSIAMKGQLNNGIDGKGMRYKVRVRAQLTDGKLTGANRELRIEGATEVILFISAGTDFKDQDFEKTVDKLLANAMKKKFAKQKENHIKNFQKLFSRVSVNLGGNTKQNLPTNERLDAYMKNPDADNALAVLFYQYGRYLGICSTRVGLLPPNLQGLWAPQIQTPWNGDYHLDVNIQMNLWSMETANLGELNLPLVDLMAGMVPYGEKTAKAYYNAEGWVAHVITNVWGFTEPGESASWGIAKAGSGWMCNNLWQHYQYTNDKKYLKEIYPIIKGSAQFYNSMLMKDPESGWLVTSPSVSPENSFKMPDGSGDAHVCMGPTIDNQIVRELFNNVITASEVLGVDATLRAELQQKLKELPPPGVVGLDGRVMEWLKPYGEPDPQHRHISHLYGLYPASLITPEVTPDLAEAAKKTLEVRGDDGPSWSIAYKQLFWARLKDGNRAYKLLKTILRPTLATGINYGAGGGVYPNLLSAGPPFQIDGNFGAAAGIGEMFIQSHAGFIELLPAIPDAWATEGTIKGLKAQGGFTVNFAWKDGKITSYEIRSEKKQPVTVKVNGELKQLTSKPL
ncbi:glycoside hydrolase [Flavobacterium akiainvivens]|uniref:Glycoside hydrolase n=1 Tax=Flavobacterium akiainvivens TaxID=1202724 RepID=A0A0M8MHS1_9FLAO|nr:glycoside hydrolase family 95 protein [Flavobacterium akiainvivens]KOS05848.1 glycoside hydrolase [Flavobacterium akiainvivens]SFQ56823.1 alpha-L-fucosidase 2 [Flavobacterium akiainvivens]